MEKINNNNTFIIDGNVSTNGHIKSKTNADTLFKFVRKFEYLKEIIENKYIAPRYNTEDVNYLNNVEIKKLTFPMICFCDINLHRLKEHVKFYGSYGIAFTKQWGMDNKFQPVHYINNKSELCNYISNSLSYYLRNIHELNEDDTNANLLLLYLMYLKPYEGQMDSNGNTKERCFQDECEWRYVPDVSPKYPQIYINDDINHEIYTYANKALKKETNYGLKFSYDDIKYVILKNTNDKKKFFNLINGLGKKGKISEEEKYLLISKIIVWNEEKEDF